MFHPNFLFESLVNGFSLIYEHGLHVLFSLTTKKIVNVKQKFINLFKIDH